MEHSEASLFKTYRAIPGLDGVYAPFTRETHLFFQKATYAQRGDPEVVLGHLRNPFFALQGRL